MARHPRSRAAGVRGGRRWRRALRGADDAARYRDALGCNVPLGLPREFTEPVRPPARVAGRAVLRHTRSLRGRRARRQVRHLHRARASVRSRARGRGAGRARRVPAGAAARASTREWCDVDVLRQLRRRSLAVLRREVEPVEPAAYARFVAAWHGIGSDRRGVEALVEAIGQLQGAAVGGQHRRARGAPRQVAPLSADRPRRAVHCRRAGVGRSRRHRLGRWPGAVVLRRSAGAVGRRGGDARSARWRAARSRRVATSPSAAPRFWSGLRAAVPAPPTSRCSARCGTWCGPAK